MISFKTRIIITFSVLTALLVILLSRFSYVSVREIYLSQLSEHTEQLTRMISQQIDRRHLAYLEGAANNSLAHTFYINDLSDRVAGLQLPNAFIFDEKMIILVQTDRQRPSGQQDPRLLLNRTEITALAIGESRASRPFKGEDGLWYMWGFARLDNSRWLGIHENAGRLEKIESLATTYVALGLGGIALTIICGWLLARTLSRPIDRLIRFSRLLGEGNFETPLPEGISGELSLLATALDRMRDNIAQNQQEKAAMLAQIAHEIRNPLGGIELLTGLLKEDLQKQNLAADYADTILKEVAGLKQLISDYLQFSRPMPPEQQWVSVSKTVRELAAIYGGPGSAADKISENKAVAFTGEDLELYFDPHHLRQVLGNLIKNSLEISNGRTRIEIAAENNATGPGIRVSDNGPGIPEADLTNIFNPFFTTRPEGTGLGLAICQKLCLENHSSIRAENNPEAGCSFIISMNKSAGRKTGKPAAEIAAEVGQR